MSLSLWVIYDHPRDYPTGYVLREWTMMPEGAAPKPIASYAKTLDMIRLLLPEGVTRVQYDGQDPDPCILEVWM